MHISNSELKSAAHPTRQKSLLKWIAGSCGNRRKSFRDLCGGNSLVCVSFLFAKRHMHHIPETLANLLADVLSNANDMARCPHFYDLPIVRHVIFDDARARFLARQAGDTELDGQRFLHLLRTAPPILDCLNQLLGWLIIRLLFSYCNYFRLLRKNSSNLSQGM